MLLIGCLISYTVLSRTRPSDLDTSQLPMTMREYFQKISVEEDRWLVTYLPGNWTRGITHLLNIPNWGTVIVGEAVAAPPDCISPKCFYLSPLETGLLNFSVTRHLKGSQKKLIGQMVAMILGAEQILPIEIYRMPLNHLSLLELAVKTSGLVHRDGAVFNPYELQRHLVSSDHIFAHEPEIKPLIFAAVRSTKKLNSQPPNQQFPSMFHMSHSSFVNLDSMDVIFSHDAFWSMIYPVLNNVLGYGVLDSFLAQKLVHELGKTVTVLEPISKLHPDVTGTKEADEAVNEFVKDIVLSLNKLKCKEIKEPLVKCINVLFIDLVKKRLFPPNSLQILKDFLKDLAAINYHFPVIESHPKLDKFNFSVYLSGKNIQSPAKRLLIKYSNITKICPGKKFGWHDPVIQDILLIVTFSKPADYQSIPLLDLMYRRWFSHVVYCGRDVRVFTAVLKTLGLPVSLLNVYFIDGLDEAGLFSQTCMLSAMVINFKITGYLQIKSDTLLNPWKIAEFPRDKIVVTGNMGTIDTKLDKKKYWNWWEAKCGKAAWRQFFSYLDRTRNTDTQSKKFLEIFSGNTKPNTAYYSGWNLFYVPTTFRDNYIHAANKSVTSGLMNELALSTIILGLTNKTEFYQIKDNSLWGNDSLNYDKLYAITDVFLHQFNLRTELKTAKGQNFLCNIYLINSEKQLKTAHKIS